MGLFLALLIASEAQAPPPALPAWMAGCWEQRSGDKWTEECWTAPKAGIMLGSGRSGTGDALREWEVMQIERAETDDPAIPQITYYGAPGGQNRTAFVWVGGDAKSATFLNEAHDYPQRIRYWREGQELVAEIAMKDGSKAVSWRYKPAGN